MKRTGPPLLDLHDLGQRQTGNENWARGISRALFERAGPDSYDIAVTSAVRADDLAALRARHRFDVSGRSTKRLAWDLPRALRSGNNSAVLVQYTVPAIKVPAVVAIHDLSFEDPRAREWLPPATRMRYKATVRASVRRAVHIIVDSDHTRQDLLGRYDTNPDSVTVVPLAVDPRFSEMLRSTPEQRSHRPTILVVGNVLPRKNLPVVARAVRILRDRGEDVVLRIVGMVHRTGRADAKRARQLLGGDAVTVTGYVAPAALARELRSAHVLAFPSLFEGFGIPVLEAMASGLPVVASDRTSLPEVIGSAGLLVPAEDPSAWADALSQAMRPDVAAHLRAAGQTREQEFTWARSAEVVRACLAQAADE